MWEVRESFSQWVKLGMRLDGSLHVDWRTRSMCERGNSVYKGPCTGLRAHLRNQKEDYVRGVQRALLDFQIASVSWKYFRWRGGPMIGFAFQKECWLDGQMIKNPKPMGADQQGSPHSGPDESDSGGGGPEGGRCYSGDTETWTEPKGNY